MKEETQCTYKHEHTRSQRGPTGEGQHVHVRLEHLGVEGGRQQRAGGDGPQEVRVRHARLVTSVMAPARGHLVRDLEKARVEGRDGDGRPLRMKGRGAVEDLRQARGAQYPRVPHPRLAPVPPVAKISNTRRHGVMQIMRKIRRNAQTRSPNNTHHHTRTPPPSTTGYQNH